MVKVQCKSLGSVQGQMRCFYHTFSPAAQRPSRGQKDCTGQRSRRPGVETVSFGHDQAAALGNSQLWWMPILDPASQMVQHGRGEELVSPRP